MSLDNLDPQDRDLIYEMYSLGLLEPEEMAEVRSKIEAGDAQAMEGMRRAALLTSSLAHVAPEMKPHARLRRQLLIAAGAPERGTGWAWIVALAATTVILGVITFNMWQDVNRRELQLTELRTQLQSSEQFGVQARELYDFLRQPSTINVKFGDGQPEPPKGQVFINRERGVLLFAGNLPAMPVGKIFEMWFVPKGGGAPIPAGLFRGEGGQGIHFQRGAVDPSKIAAIAVTLEPEAGSTTPSMPILFAAPVEAE